MHGMRLGVALSIDFGGVMRESSLVELSVIVIASPATTDTEYASVNTQKPAIHDPLKTGQ
jgi:hypothetical protein